MSGRKIIRKYKGKLAEIWLNSDTDNITLIKNHRRVSIGAHDLVEGVHTMYIEYYKAEGLLRNKYASMDKDNQHWIYQQYWEELSKIPYREYTVKGDWQIEITVKLKEIKNKRKTEQKR